jgi:hypothetical protein
VTARDSGMATSTEAQIFFCRRDCQTPDDTAILSIKNIEEI